MVGEPCNVLMVLSACSISDAKIFSVDLYAWHGGGWAGVGVCEKAFSLS